MCPFPVPVENESDSLYDVSGESRLTQIIIGHKRRLQGFCGTAKNIHRHNVSVWVETSYVPDFSGFKFNDSKR